MTTGRINQVTDDTRRGEAHPATPTPNGVVRGYTLLLLYAIIPYLHI